MTTVGHLPNGSRGVDCNSPISRASAALFFGKGFTFAIRYVRRAQTNSYDLTTGEALGILAGGLGLMIVQHVAAPGWTASAQLGTQYGTTAASECQHIGIPAGVTVWCDLESVDEAATPASVIGYCNAWHAAVSDAGYVPGLYVGYQCGLTPTGLYRNLRFRSYWSAYTNNSDSAPIVRGFQMRQKVARPADMIPGFTNQNLDIDYIWADALGGTPSLLLP